MPLVFRLMKRDGTLPRVGNTATGLGVRTPKDIDVGGDGMVVLNNKGMSVRPAVKDIPLDFLPERIDPAGWGENANRVFRYGEGEFTRCPFAAGLELFPDAEDHGVVQPIAVVSLQQYRADIVATRPHWVDIEN